MSMTSKINRIKGGKCICGKTATYTGNSRNPSDRKRDIYYCGKVDCAIEMGKYCDDMNTCWHSSKYCNNCGTEFHHLLDKNENFCNELYHQYCDDCYIKYESGEIECKVFTLPPSLSLLRYKIPEEQNVGIVIKKPLGKNKDDEMRFKREYEELYKVQEELAELSHAISKYTKWGDSEAIKALKEEWEDVLSAMKMVEEMTQYEGILLDKKHIVVKVGDR